MRGMTAYATVAKKRKNFSLDVTIRSGNSKYLEIFTYQLLPERVFLEEAIKKEVRKKISRGRVEIYFSLHAHPKQKLIVNKDLLKQYYRAMRNIGKEFKIEQKYSPSRLLTLPGITHLQEQNVIDNRVIISAVKEGVSTLLKFKEREGEIIASEISKNLNAIKRNHAKIKKIKGVLNGEDEGGKDISEEIALISFYMQKLEKLLLSKNTVPKGKAIDFLTQEILRELNAASSKTKLKKVSWWIIEAKSFLERIREQAQNVE